jgi:hypothetical protein
MFGIKRICADSNKPVACEAASTWVGRGVGGSLVVVGVSINAMVGVAVEGAGT